MIWVALVVYAFLMLVLFAVCRAASRADVSKETWQRFVREGLPREVVKP
jgi:hypothetical protein